MHEVGETSGQVRCALETTRRTILGHGRSLRTRSERGKRPVWYMVHLKYEVTRESQLPRITEHVPTNS